MSQLAFHTPKALHAQTRLPRLRSPLTLEYIVNCNGLDVHSYCCKCVVVQRFLYFLEVYLRFTFCYFLWILLDISFYISYDFIPTFGNACLE